jgi:hypothetical protein
MASILRNYDLAEPVAMMEQAGFQGIRAVSGFAQQPATDEDEVFCILGTKGRP